MQLFSLDWQTHAHASGDVQKVLLKKKKEKVSEERGSKIEERRKGQGACVEFSLSLSPKWDY